MKKNYITPTVCCVNLCISSLVCASEIITLHRREGVTGEEADSKAFAGTVLWDDSDDAE